MKKYIFMENHFFKNIRIQNFKSLRDVELEDCSRINLFIGKPNVGKSNILEALSMFSLKQPKPAGLILFKELIRIENEIDLFFNGDESQNITIQADNHRLTYKYDFQYGLEEKGENLINNEKSSVEVKKYAFQSYNINNLNLVVSSSSNTALDIPFGGNLLNVLQRNSRLLNECRDLFKEYGLQLLMDKGTKSLRIAKTNNNGSDELPIIFTIPYGSVADTLQRIIFYKTAIVTNSDAILLFEEPEAHAFPPYISLLTQEVINSKTNQFFMTTHSPFVVNDFLEEARDALSVFVVGWKNGETTVKKLSKEQLYDVYQYGVDLFFNNETFI